MTLVLRFQASVLNQIGESTALRVAISKVVVSRTSKSSYTYAPPLTKSAVSWCNCKLGSD